MTQTHYYFFTWRTYGTWLPGEDGFVGGYRTWDGRRVSDNQFGMPTTPPMPTLARHAATLLKTAPVRLERPQAEMLCETFLRHGIVRQYAVDAIAVMADHIHLTFTSPDSVNLDRTLGDWKAYASRTLNQLHRQHELRSVGTVTNWWAVGGSKRKPPDEGEYIAAVVYTATQQNPIVVWQSDRATVWQTEIQTGTRCVR